MPASTFEAAVPESLIVAIGHSSNAMIIEDLANHPVAKKSPVVLKAGMKTALSAPIRFGGRLQATLNFFSREPGWFTPDDLPIAQRGASHIGLAMSHHRLAEKARLTAEANARAERLESHVQQLTNKLDALSSYRRVIGESQQWRDVLKRQLRWQELKQRSSSWVSLELGRKSLRALFIGDPRVRIVPLSRSTVPPCRSSSWKRSSLGSKPGRL